jgi:hypothetical protein
MSIPIIAVAEIVPLHQTLLRIMVAGHDEVVFPIATHSLALLV